MRVLGLVNWTNLDKAGKPIAGVRPLYEIEKREWRKIDAEQEYPSQGQVFWFNALEAFDNALVYFRPEANIVAHKDRFTLVEPQIAFEIIDLRSLGNAETVRAALVLGRRRPGIPSSRVFLWCAPNQLVGPVKLSRISDGTVRFDAGNRDKVPSFAITEPRRIEDGTQERLLRPDDAPCIGYVDWDDDAQVLRRALQHVVSVARRSGGDLAYTKRQIEELSEALVAGGTGPDAELHRYRIDRARALLANNGLVSALAPDLIQILFDHPRVIEELRRTQERTRADLEATLRAELATKLESERNALREAESLSRQVNEELAGQQERLRTLRDEFDTLTRDHARAAQEIEAAVSERVRKALERPAELLAEASVLRPLLGTSSLVLGSSQSRSAWSRSDAGIIVDVTERGHLQRVIKDAAHTHGVQASSVLHIYAVLAARLVPITLGPSALAAFVAYSRATCGARLGILNISPAFIQPQDLFGTANGSNFEAHPFGLFAAADAVREAQGPALLVLEGANRAPLESYLLPLLQLREAGLAFSAAHLPRDFTVPPGLLVGATLVAGATTVPVSPELWAYAVAVEPQSGPIAPMSPTVSTPSQIAVSSDLLTLGTIPQATIDSVLEDWPECAPVQSALARYGAALSGVGLAEDAIYLALLKGIVLPFMVSSAADADTDNLVSRLRDSESELAVAVTRLVARLR